MGYETLGKKVCAVIFWLRAIGVNFMAIGQVRGEIGKILLSVVRSLF